MNQLYNEVIKYESIHTLTIQNLIDPPEGFYIFLDDMKEEFKKYNKGIQEFLVQKKDLKKREISISFYRIQIVLDYHSLFKDYGHLLK